MKIKLIKTDKDICFISDYLDKNDRTCYEYKYKNSNIPELYFDGKKAESSFHPHWFKIDNYPNKIEKKVSGEYINKRYEIKDKSLICDKYPEILDYNFDRTLYDESVILSLYSYKNDKQEDYFKEIEVDIETIFELNNFKEPKILNFKGIKKENYSEQVYTISEKDVEYQLLDEIIFPEIYLSQRPCKLTSKQVYDITRQYIKENIDLKVAKITSDYNFCFSVKKMIPLLEPEKISYQNFFARTKKERAKIHFATKTFKEIEIFDMTNSEEKYKGYPVISDIIAENQEDLNNKVNDWLKYVVENINRPIEMCPHCEGLGYVKDFESVKLNQVNYNIKGE